MADQANRYLIALQTGYRLDEIDVPIDGPNPIVTVLPSNPWRIYVHLSAIGISAGLINYRLPSGLLVPIGVISETTSIKLTMAHDYAAPTEEITSPNTLAIGARIIGFCLVKLQ